MKRIIKVVILCFITTSLFSQNLVGVKSLNRIEKLDGLYFDINTEAGDELSLRVSNSMDTLYSVFADENYCLILSKIREKKECFVSAAYKKDGIWIQDYTNRSLFYLDTGISTTFINSVTIIDGTTLQVNLSIEVFNEVDHIKSKVSLYSYGFYDHHMKSSLGILFSEELKQQESIRKGPLYEYIKKNGSN